MRYAPEFSALLPLMGRVAPTPKAEGSGGVTLFAQLSRKYPISSPRSPPGESALSLWERERDALRARGPGHRHHPAPKPGRISART